MEVTERETLESDVRQRVAAGDPAGAASAAIRGYGPEVLGFLVAHAGDADADEVFAIWAERLWQGLPRFGWACSLRTWAYAVARNAARNYVRDRDVRRRRHEALPDSEALVHAAAVRTETRSFLRTNARDRFAAVRAGLPEDDRALLVLRIDRRLEWKDLARVMLGEDEAVSDAALLREAQRLRKRFQHLKERLVAELRAQGLAPHAKGED